MDRSPQRPLSIFSGPFSDLVGSETRRTGRFVITSAILLVLVAADTVEVDSLPGLGLRLSGTVTTLELLLVSAVAIGVVVFALRLVSDLERFYVAQVRARIELLQWQASTMGRDAEAAEQESVSEPDGAAERLEARLSGLNEDMARLRAAGEAGSRFTRFAAERSLLQSEMQRVERQLSELAGDGVRTETTRAIDQRLSELEEIERYRVRLEQSSLLRFSRIVTVTLDLVLAPVISIAAITYWAWVI